VIAPVLAASARFERYLMTKSKRMTVYTSIPPSIRRIVQGKEIGTTYQNACINSWREAGLSVVSLNSESEIQPLKEQGLPVEFVSNGSQSDRSKIASLLSLIAKSGEPVAGIINADCLLIHYHDFVGAISRAAHNSIVLFERLNLNPSTIRPTGEHCYGFDAFFFDTRFIGDFKSSGSWLIGQTYWDHWFPLMLINAGAKLKISAPGLVHLNHDVRWQWANWGANATELRTSLLLLRNFDTAFPKDFVNAIKKKQTKSKFADFVFSWLRSNAEQVKLSPEGTEGELFYRLFSALSESKEPQIESELLCLKILRWTRFQYKRFRGRQAQLRRLVQPRKTSLPGDELHELFEEIDVENS
jgi:hypothetical protein